MLPYTAAEIKAATKAVERKFGSEYHTMSKESQQAELIKRLKKTKQTEEEKVKTPKRKREDKVRPPYPVTSDSDSDYVAMPAMPSEKASKSYKHKDKDSRKSSKRHAH